jgi:hypothetical protein
MTALPARRRDSLTPAFLVAALLHIGLFAAVILFRGSQPVPMGDVVPINIVSSAPVTDSRPAQVAPTAQTAQVETPVPLEKAPVPPPPAPTPTPAPLRPSPTPAKALAPQPAKTDFLDALQKSIAKAERTAPPRPAMAARGPARAETAPNPRVDAGPGVSQSDLQGLQQLLERLWNPNCSVEGGEAVIVPVKFAVGDDGRVVGRVTDRGASADPVVFAAARRAIDAVHQAEPYADPYRAKTFTVIFDAQKACAKKEG